MNFHIKNLDIKIRGNDRKIISKSEFNQWNYMALELKQDCAEGKITVNDMLQRIEVFENRKKVGKK